ncbi:MAG TPA: galactose oxidase early set domain-containing protein [Fimbriimonadaceae bacterium]|nr:galactose oxidase early set domain-containing protein [Fimbriimonadaceae bacterium]
MRSGGSRSSGDDPDPNEGPVSLFYATNRTLLLNANDVNAQWLQGPAMTYGRKNHTLTVLPDRRILAVGGNLYGDTVGALDRTNLEVMNPFDSNPSWLLGDIPFGNTWRGWGYHSTALLLPSAKVIVSGGEGEFDANGGYSGTWPNGFFNSVPKRRAYMYSPKYGGLNSWEVVRPTIGSNFPTTLGYSKIFQIPYTVASGQEIQRAVLVSLGATTHAFNQNQRLVSLQLLQPLNSTTLVAKVTGNRNLLPPGFYMLFIVDDRGGTGVPSSAKIVQVKDYHPGYPTDAYFLHNLPYDPVVDVTRLYMGDNLYLGDSNFESIGNEAIIGVESKSHSQTIPNIRVSAECKTTLAKMGRRLRTPI